MPKKICFVGLDNYPVLNPDKGDEYFGGESVQQTLLAKAFAEMGYEVSMVVKDHGQTQGEVRGGIRVWKTFKESEGVPVLRFLYPRLTRIWQALKNADAEIYYQSCAGSLTGIVARYCKVFKRQFVFRLAHDSDCIPGEQLISLWRDRKIYEYGLRNADIIAAQGNRQAGLLKKYYDLDSIPINMAVELPEPGSGSEAAKAIDVLWVNNLREFKRPELVLEIAKAYPEYRFVMIGGEVRGFERLFLEIEQKAGEIRNLEFLGAVPYGSVNNYFSEARLFLNTSDQEGFPNSFLQAWMRNTPVISFFDPDGLIETHQLGMVSKDFTEMSKAIGKMLGDREYRLTIAKRAREFALANYAPGNVANLYKRALEG